MNLLEHYIKEIHSIIDITDEFKSRFPQHIVNDRLLNVDLTFDCYGVVERKVCRFWESEFNDIKKKGYWLG